MRRPLKAQNWPDLGHSYPNPILLVGVNPFEDVPGYQLLGLLGPRFGNELFLADDSRTAIRVLEEIGVQIYFLPHPSTGEAAHMKALLTLCRHLHISLLLPASDAHLSAIARSFDVWGSMLPLCPMAVAVSRHRLFDKWAIQNWLSLFGLTPTRWAFRDERDLRRWDKNSSYPVMVKGMRKGGVKCVDRNEVLATRRTILENPANQGASGGLYLETFVAGEEHSILIVVGRGGVLLSSIGIRKIATTKLGTTVVAEIEDTSVPRVDIEKIARTLPDLSVVEIEYRVAADGAVWLFEANMRFPNWIGATGAYGQLLLEAYISLARSVNSTCIPGPPMGTLIYRLPQSGPLSMAQTFRQPAKTVRESQGASGTYSAEKKQPLWRGSSPHQFLTK